MKFERNLIIFVTFFIAAISVTSCLDPTESGETISKAKEIFENIKKNKFVDSVKSVSKWGLPLLKSLASVAKVIMSFIETESKELKFMKVQFKQLNEKMDVVDQEFENVKRAIDWNVVKVQYSKYEMAINILQDMLVDIPDAKGPVKQLLTDKFVRTYEQLYDNACGNIYNSFMTANRVYSENLVKAIRKYTDDHKGNVEQFFLGNIKLLFKGLQLETFYQSMKNFSNDHWTEEWGEKMDQLTALMTATSNEIKNNWQEQVKTDTETFNVQNYQKDNKQYLIDFYKFLNDKFSWRAWSVVVYNDISTTKEHYVRIRGGDIRFRLRGKNIVFGSASRENYPYYNKDAAQAALNEIPTKILSWGKGPAEYLSNKLAYNLGLKNVNYSVAAVIAWGAGVWYIAPNSSYRKWDGTYNRFIDLRKTYNMIVMM